MTTPRTDDELAEWMNSDEYARRVKIIDDLAMTGHMPPPETVALALDLPLDLATGLVRRAIDPEGYESFTRRTLQ